MLSRLLRTTYLCCAKERPPVLVDQFSGAVTLLALPWLAASLESYPSTRTQTHCGVFTRSGVHVLLGDSKGALSLLDVDALTHPAPTTTAKRSPVNMPNGPPPTFSASLSPTAPASVAHPRVLFSSLLGNAKDGIRGLSLDRSGALLTINATRVLRLCRLAPTLQAKRTAQQKQAVKQEADGDKMMTSASEVSSSYGAYVTILHEFSDAVNNWQWARSCFSHDGDYLLAGVASDHDHAMYVWDIDLGHLRRMIKGQRLRGMQTVAVCILFRDIQILNIDFLNLNIS